MPKSEPLIINSILGRNNYDAPQDLPADMGTAVTNMDFFRGAMGRKRAGAANVTLNGFTAAGVVGAMARYLPEDDETLAELFATDSDVLTTVQRLTGGTTWATVALADAFASALATRQCNMVNFHGRLYMAYNTTVDRLHVYPSVGGTHTRCGLATPGTPTSASGGAGAVTATRRYGVCWTRQENSITVRRSNRSALSTALTLSAETVTITRPAAASESETHWECYAYTSADNYSIGRLIATTAIATTTATDNNTVAGLLALTTAPPLAGQNTPFPSVLFLLADGTHLIGAGAYEPSAGTATEFARNARLVCWTPALGTSPTDGDDMRVVNTTTTKAYLYVDQAINGLGGPLDGSIYVFGYRVVWKLMPTGVATSAYRRITLRTDIGCISHKSICLGEDAEGRPALYWMSHKGPYRAGQGGIEFIGRDIQDRIDVMNQAATSRVVWGLYVPELQQVHWYVATGSSNTPNERWVFDTRLGRVIEWRNLNRLHYGWAIHTGRSTESLHGCLFANTLGVAMSYDLLPYIGRVGTGITAPTIWKTGTGTDDAGTTFSATVQTKAYALIPGQNMRMLEDAYLLAPVSSGVTLTLTITRDFGVETSTATASIAAAASETSVFPKFEGAQMSEAAYVQFTVGDASAVSNAWRVDALVTPLQIEGAR